MQQAVERLIAMQYTQDSRPLLAQKENDKESGMLDACNIAYLERRSLHVRSSH
jgi:hypothetical protein